MSITVSKQATADVDVSADAVFSVLQQPHLLARLTPFVHDITALDDDLWRWSLVGLPYPGGHLNPSFTERMTFTPNRLLVFDHAPPAGSRELVGARGTYTLTDRRDGRPGCTLSIDIAITTYLPVPWLSRPLVSSAMQMVIARMGDEFSRNLIAELRRSHPEAHAADHEHHGTPD